jgi:3-phosphoshikimate 1-carboxyvinyltransferase
MRQRVVSAERLEGTLFPPGDKSISHRAILLNAIARGSSRITNCSTSVDCEATISCIRKLGVLAFYNHTEPSVVTVEGSGGLLWEPSTLLDAGNSGTTLRLLSGILAGQSFFSVVTGDQSLRSRPMVRIIEPLKLMGADIQGRRDDALAPLAIHGGGLHGIDYHLPIASSQVKSALLLAGLQADSPTRLTEPAPSRDHTENMLAAMGAEINSDGIAITIAPGELTALDIRVPGDISAASFWIVAAAAHPNALLEISGVGINPSRAGVLEILKRMGADIQLNNLRKEGGEPVADIVVRSSGLEGIKISGDIIPNVIDELPALAVAACFAQGTTVIRDAAELRMKETDRITAMVQGLRHMGAVSKSCRMAW